MIKKDKTMNINVFDGDDGIKYIRYSDFEKMVDRIKQVHDEIEEEKDKEIERLNKCIDEALEIIIKDWNDKCTIPIHSVVDTGEDIRIKLYYQLFFKGLDKK